MPPPSPPPPGPELRPAPDAWLAGPTSPSAGLRLFCLPPAGSGAATYRKWPQGLSSAIQVYRIQPPGREGRFREPFCPDLATYIDAVATLIAREGSRPFALFGHSMGALLAYAIATAVRERAGVEPIHLFVSAFRSPAAPPPPPIHDLPDTEFLEQLRIRYDGVPPQVLEHPELLQLLLPIVRSDLSLLQMFRYEDRGKLTCPVSALGGRSDPWVDTMQLEQWRETTTGPFELHLFDGGHFYLDNALPLLLQLIERRLG